MYEMSFVDGSGQMAWSCQAVICVELLSREHTLCLRFFLSPGRSEVNFEAASPEQAGSSSYLRIVSDGFPPAVRTVFETGV